MNKGKSNIKFAVSGKMYTHIKYACKIMLEFDQDLCKELNLTHQSSTATGHQLHIICRHCASFSMSEPMQVVKVFVRLDYIHLYSIVITLNSYLAKASRSVANISKKGSKQ